MKKIKLTTLLFACLLPCINSFGQDSASCRVEIQPIAGKYSGECKNGKAHGIGKATGTDSYEGEFKKGYPDGAGTYTWQNGNYFSGNFKKRSKQGKGVMSYKRPANADSIVSGFWKKDVYAGLYEKPWEFFNEGRGTLLNKMVIKQGASRNTVRFTANKDMLGNYLVKDGSFGRVNAAGSVSSFYIEFQEVKFPFRIEFNGMLGPIDMVVYEDGDWEVALTFAH